MLIAGSCWHLEDDVRKWCRLWDLPMKTSSSAVHLTDIDDEVSDSAEAGRENLSKMFRPPERKGRLTSCFDWHRRDCHLRHCRSFEMNTSLRMHRNSNRLTNDGNSNEIGRGQQGRQVPCVSDELSLVKCDNWCGNFVCAIQTLSEKPDAIDKTFTALEIRTQVGSRW